MKKCGEFNGFTIWVPDLNDIVMSKECFGSIRYRLENTFNMIPAAPPNSEIAESCQLPTTQQGGTLPQIAAAEKLCKVYFDIAASCIGEAEVRKRMAAATSSVA